MRSVCLVQRALGKKPRQPRPSHFHIASYSGRTMECIQTIGSFPMLHLSDPDQVPFKNGRTVRMMQSFDMFVRVDAHMLIFEHIPSQDIYDL